jgi:transcriptional regulator GlxA family with amidase domain
MDRTRFRAAVGQPPMAYLTELRLRRAAGYLSTTTKSVREIARLAGYGNEASFSKAFSRLFGRPPGQYRREPLAAPRLGERGGVVGGELLEGAGGTAQE